MLAQEHATASCCRCAEHRDEIVLRTRGLSHPRRGRLGNVVGPDQGRRRRRRRDRGGRSRSPTTRRSPRRNPRRRPRCSAAGALPSGTAAPRRRRARPRRVRSAPRGRSPALRRRSRWSARARFCRVSSPTLPPAGQSARPRPHSGSRRAARSRSLRPGARRSRRSSPTQVSRSASRASTSPPTARRADARRREQPVTDLRVETTAVSRLLAARPVLSGSVSWSVLHVVLIKVVSAFVVLLVAVMLYIWGMRKVIADMQNRIGPNRGGPVRRAADPRRRHQAVLQGAVDPVAADRPVFRLAPVLVDHARVLDVLRRPASAARCRFSVTGRTSRLPTSRWAALFILAMSGLGVYGVMLAGWSSGSKYPLLGSVRASAQLLSYEAAFGLAVLGVLIQAGTLSTHDIVGSRPGSAPSLVREGLVLAARPSCRSGSS